MPSHLTEKLTVMRKVPVAKDLVTGEIDKIPIVDEVHVTEILVHDLLAFCFGCFRILVPPQKDKKASQPHLVIRRGNQRIDVGIRTFRPMRLDDCSRLRNLHTEKFISLAVLPLARLKEAHQDLALRKASDFPQLSQYDIHGTPQKHLFAISLPLFKFALNFRYASRRDVVAYMGRITVSARDSAITRLLSPRGPWE